MPSITTMATSAVEALGQALAGFLTAKFSAPPGTAHSLGFLGTGVAVDPPSLQSEGVFNPARINSWLSVVADPVGTIVREGNRVQATAWTAAALMDAIAGMARTAAPAESEEQKAFMRARSQAMENLGGSLAITASPLDWYDPAGVSQWPNCELQSTMHEASASMRSSGPANEGGTPAQPSAPAPLWAWRKLEPVRVADSSSFAVNASLIDPAAPRHAWAPEELPSQALRRLDGSPPMAQRGGLATRIHATTETGQRSAAGALRNFLPRIDAAPAAASQVATLAPRRQEAVQAVLVAQALSQRAESAVTRSVDANSMALKMRYLVVQLARSPWWSELMMTLDNWYVPGLARGALAAAGDSSRVSGLPVALILTSQVSLKAIWSSSDRSAATANTHFGPWDLESASFGETAQSGEAELSIPGIQVMGCIYRELPALPPVSAPDAEAGPTGENR